MVMKHDVPPMGRRGLLTLAVAFGALSWDVAEAQTTGGNSPTAPVARLDDALLASMKGGGRMSFDERYRTLGPVIDQVFNMDTVLANSVGLSWATQPEARKTELATAFRRYTVSSYVSNFNSYNGQSFQVLPNVRAVGDGEVVVQSRLLRTDDSPLQLDYVMRAGPSGWQVVDVLMNGSISRVAVQRSDFRQLLKTGGVPALVAGLGNKVASLSGGMLS
jgi:phospholipid transport system substrate-binding protein